MIRTQKKLSGKAAFEETHLALRAVRRVRRKCLQLEIPCFAKVFFRSCTFRLNVSPMWRDAMYQNSRLTVFMEFARRARSFPNALVGQHVAVIFFND